MFCLAELLSTIRITVSRLLFRMGWRKLKKPRNKGRDREMFDLSFYENKYDYIVGIDESGWGPIAGPMYVAGVVLDPDIEVPPFIKDSKKLSDLKLAEAREWIIRNSVTWVQYCVHPWEFHRPGAGPARRHAFKKVHNKMVDQLKLKVVEPHWTSFTLIDGSFSPIPPQKGSSVVKGDAIVPAISAASIIAKTARDSHMKLLSRAYPEFHFDKNKGYATKLHIEALEKFGATPIHRKNIRMVKEAQEYDPRYSFRNLYG